ncbi:MAG: sigma 54-interacting transcriptional regulator [Firmicutes bacterium]|nr:sigma 54-interacting transcriptional regulator [Bacillota bacterium]
MRRRNDPVLNRFEYIDGITVIDLSGTILFSVKFNRRLAGDTGRLDDIVGMRLFEAFPSVTAENSTLLNAIKRGRPVYKPQQRVVDLRGNTITTTNCTFPIKSGNRIVGAIEISKCLVKGDDENPPADLLCKAIRRSAWALMDRNLQPDRARYSLDDILTSNPQMVDLKEKVRRVAAGRSPVFIVGETGTGKELLAHAIHNEGPSRENPFISQNVAAIPDSLLESILFGTVRGSFTGATDLPGLFELASGGTLYLDEIDSMPLHLQAKLLRVLQDGFVRRLGDSRMRQFDVRIIASSSQPPGESLRQGRLRPDLFYRLNAINLTIPPLRARLDDLHLLTGWFIGKHAELARRPVTKVSREVMDLFRLYAWPGNVRELEHVIEHAINIMPEIQDVMEVEHLPEYFREFPQRDGIETATVHPLKETVELVERQLIRKAINMTGGNVSRAARLLKIPRQTMQSKLARYNIGPVVPTI